MPVFPRMRDFPEALVKILLTIMEKTPNGGATMEDLKEAYQETRGSTPSSKTIYRNIRRLNLIFNPLAYGETPEEAENEDKDDFASGTNGLDDFSPVIQSCRQKGETRYLFSGELPVGNINANNALLMALGLYTQQRGLLKGHYESAIRDTLRDMLARLSAYNSVYREIERHIHVSGYGSADPGKNITKIKEIMRAIHHRKRIRLEYLRSYDGTLTKRDVEPYGLICRLNNWYLIANCMHHQQRRVFLLDQTRRLEVIENSTFRWPEGFSLHDTYGSAWGVWTAEDEKSQVKETVRLKVARGVAERFRLMSFHDSQQTEILPDGQGEVTFTVKGASEMIPWLMSWGAALEVMEPQWLREAFVANVESVLEMYR